ncbi:hypothetical protein L2E82_04481 [Cichorium intybus]|uniref:Uncharacterized protein n=1 Tax=Cichorium intybus TaxID=13427 RepID=A0ACB9H551_CICIN|nr:hypothetical protein L2E82_04481 [Cichorium intybus]
MTNSSSIWTNSKPPPLAIASRLPNRAQNISLVIDLDRIEPTRIGIDLDLLESTWLESSRASPKNSFSEGSVGEVGIVLGIPQEHLKMKILDHWQGRIARF